MYFLFSGFCVVILKIYNLLLGLGIIKTHTFSVPIVSVGNITLGGSGKTPFVYYLARLLTQHGITHAVVSRGYKKALSGTCIVHDGKTMLSASPFSCVACFRIRTRTRDARVHGRFQRTAWHDQRIRAPGY